MRTYISGKQYEFIVNYFYTTLDDYGREKLWLSLSDGESPRKYNVPAFPYQKTGYEGKTVMCTVSKVLDSGYPYLLQDKVEVLEHCYNKGETYWFSVLEKCVDSYSGRPYFNLIDRINNITHRFYCSEQDELSGLVPVIVKDIKGSHLELQLEAKEESKAGATGVAAPKELDKLHNPFGHEDSYHEWKASLVFPSNSSDQDNPDVEQQIKNIMRSIAGFQNAEGGLLYLGVTDFGEVRGIEADYAHLDEGDDKVSYQKNTDGFENKIRTAVNHYLGKMSLDNIKFKFYLQQSSGHIFCVITVSKTTRPVFREGRDVFKRFGNGYRALKGEEITDLAYDKLNDTAEQLEFSLTMPDDCIELNPNINVEALRQAPSSSDVVKISTDFLKKMDYYYMTFYTDDQFIYSKESHASDENVLTEVRFNRIDGNLEYSRDILVKCLKDGHAQLIQAYDLCKLGEPDTLIKLPVKDILTLKVAHKYDFVKVLFNDGTDDREKYLRLTSLFGKDTEADLRSNKDEKGIRYEFKLKGNMMIPTGCTLQDVTIVHESLPDEIQFVSARPGASGKGSVVGSQSIDTASY